MALELRRTDPFEMRSAIVDFFWRIQMWPYPTKDQYLRYWDWRQRCLSEQRPVAWGALDGTTVVGHITVVFRQAACNGQRIRAAVTANYRVEAAYRASPVSGALGNAPRSLVRSGEVDVLLGFGNRLGHRVEVALGSRPLGPMTTLAKVSRWGPILRRRSRVLGALAPLVGAAVRARNLVRNGRGPAGPEGLVGRALGADELATLDRSHWQHRDGLTWDGTLTAFANHFCPSEFRDSRVVGVLDRSTSRLEGLVALVGENDLQVLQCAVNEAALSADQAVEIAIGSMRGVDSVRVPLLPQTKLARGFTDAGYLRLPVAYSNPVFRNTSWAAHWRKGHPLSAALEDTRGWNLWYGWSHH